MQTQQKGNTSKGGVLTFLTEFAGEAVHALALLPRPAVQTGAPVSAGTGSAGSFQSRASTDTMIQKLTITQSTLTSQRGSVETRKLTKTHTHTGADELWFHSLCSNSEKSHKEPRRISILKDPSSPHYSAARERKKTSLEFCNWFPPIKNLYLKKTTTF